MRLHLHLTASSKPVPYDHLPVMVGALHKWMQRPDLHDTTSLYSFSWLQGGVSLPDQKGLSFPNGASFFISAHDEKVVQSIYDGIHKSPEFAFGMRVSGIDIEKTPDLAGSVTFNVASPVFIKRKNDLQKEEFFLYDDQRADALLTQTLHYKLSQAGIDPMGASVVFDRQKPGKKRIKYIIYKGIGLKASICPVTITGNPQQLAFAWNTGVGSSTGIGFGALLRL